MLDREHHFEVVNDKRVAAAALHLEPGQVINVYPPFCTEEAKNGVSLKPVSITEAIVFLSDFSKKINTVGNGGKVEIRVTE